MNEWDNYWDGKTKPHNKLYDRIAVQYRKYIIKPYLKKYITKHFTTGSILLHAGCGGGQVEDNSLHKEFILVGLDFSEKALNFYKTNHSNYNLILGNISTLSIKTGSLDGVFNLGVMEHSTKKEIRTTLIEFNRVTKSDGTIILFVPPEYGSTVIFFKILHYILNTLLHKNIYFQPAEINRIKSQEWTKNIIEGTGLKITEFNFEPIDLYTHIAIVLKKI